MSQLDLLNLARSCGQNISSDFAQVITITFAMVVAIYYFLHQAGVRMKVFAFTIYTCGMLDYLEMMLMESGVGVGAQQALIAIPVDGAGTPDAGLAQPAVELGRGHVLGLTRSQGRSRRCTIDASGEALWPRRSVAVFCATRRPDRARHGEFVRRRTGRLQRGSDQQRRKQNGLLCESRQFDAELTNQSLG